MFDLIDSGNAPLTMTSREIAELTGKRHDNVMTDIRKMLDELGITAADFSTQYKDSYGRMQPCFNLPHRECMILVSGYSIPMRARIVDRWEALETGKAKPAAVSTNRASEVTALQLALVSAQMSADILRLEGSARLGMLRRAHELAGASHLLPMLPVYAINAK
jgi:phage regulator Rha-like protein